MTDQMWFEIRNVQLKQLQEEISREYEQLDPAGI